MITVQPTNVLSVLIIEVIFSTDGTCKRLGRKLDA